MSNTFTHKYIIIGRASLDALFFVNEAMIEFPAFSRYKMSKRKTAGGGCFEKRHLESRSFSRVQLLTAPYSQGREWDTVILSVVDTQKMFFTDSKNKFSKGVKIINTAISRAKKELVIICDKNFWQTNNNDQLIGNLVSNCSTFEPAR